jgi:exoribonuclease-2
LPGELVVTASVLRDNLVKMTEIPLVFRAPSLPEQLPAKTHVQLAVTSIDLLDLSLQTRYVATLASSDENNADDEADLDEYLTEEALAKDVAETPVAAIERPAAAEITEGGEAAC